jgi:hypothetical protein
MVFNARGGAAIVLVQLKCTRLNTASVMPTSMSDHSSSTDLHQFIFPFYHIILSTKICIEMKAFVTILFLVPFLLLAHAGHGPVDSGPAHYLLSIEHYLGFAALLGVAYYIYYRRTKVKSDA